MLSDVFDVYILQNRQTVKLVDFNPFSPTTDGLLYGWAELYQSKEKDYFILQTLEAMEGDRQLIIHSCFCLHSVARWQ